MYCFVSHTCVPLSLTQLFTISSHASLAPIIRQKQVRNFQPSRQNRNRVSLLNLERDLSFLIRCLALLANGSITPSH